MKYKNKFVQLNLYKKEQITEREYRKFDGSKLSEYDDSGLQPNYYKLMPAEFTEAEFEQAIQLKIYEQLEELNKKQNTIKNIMIFFTVVVALVGIGLLCAIG